MKICPFLVAGEDSLQRRGTMSLRTPVVTPRLEITRNDVDMARETESPVATELWSLEEQAPPRAGLECLGEPCRFFHAGGCRFDLLFAVGPGAGAPAAPPSTLLFQEGENDSTTLGSVLQEVWSLQRETLREMIGGFRRFEGEQSRQQAALAGHIEQLAARSDEAHPTSPELARVLDERLGALQSVLPILDRTQTDVHATRTEIESARAAIEGTRNDVATTHTEIEKTRVAVEGTCSDIATTRTEVEKTRATLEGVQSDIAAARQDLAQSRTTIETVRGTIADAREETSRTVQEASDAIRRALVESAEEARARLEQLLAQNSSASRAELERSLQRVLEDNQDVRGLRADLQQALQTLAGHVREVATAAASLASSSRLAEDLLVEQRGFAEALLERERRDEARRLNNAGVLAYHEGAYDSSVEKFRRAVHLDASLAEAWNNLGLSYTEMQADGEALEAFKKALELDPSVGQIYNNLGYLYHRRGEIEEAVEMYQRATQRATDSSAAWSNLGNALHTLARRDEAVSAWKQALALDPSNDKAAGALERLGLGGN